MIITLKVKTGQKVSKIEAVGKHEFIVHVKSLPTKNKANLEVIDLVSNYLDIPRSKIKIKLGKYNSNKTLYIEDQSELKL